MKIRPAIKEDIAVLAEMRQEFLAESFGPQPDDLTREVSSKMKLYMAEHLGRDFFAVITEKNSKPIGTAFLVLTEFPASPRIRTGRTGEIINVLTRPAFRRQGLATAMIEKLIETAARVGISKICLSANEAGCAIYEKIGFRPMPAHRHLEYLITRIQNQPDLT